MAKKSRAKHPRCRWCGKRLDSKGHREKTESFCFVLNEKRIRSDHRPRVKSVSECYEGDRLRPEFIGTDMEDKLMQRQRRLAVDALLQLSRNGYRVPRNVEYFLQGGFVWNQIARRRPWAVYVLVDGKRKRKRFNNLFDAVKYHSRIHEKYPSSGIVSLGQSYELPQALRLKKDQLPKKFKWCPRCAAFRVFKRVEPPVKFDASVKRPTTDPKKIARGIMFEWTYHAIWLTECQLCGLPNRDAVMRRSNIPYEVRRIKRGVKKIKPRYKTERGKKARDAKRNRRRVR